MKRRHIWPRPWLGAVILFAAAGALLATAQAPEKSAQPEEAKRAARVLEININDVILPLTAEFVGDAFDTAEKQKVDLILITMNTPGGLDTSMREIIQRILGSRVPVAVYVSPSGSRAASAGFYILLSADIAAMAPGTNTGAASPILTFAGEPVKINETLQKKIINDATAYLRSIAEKRGRNPDVAIEAVTDARAFTENQALKDKLIDLVVENPEDLLAQLDGREIRRFDGSKMTLALPNPVRTPMEMTGKQKFLAKIARPDVLFILFILGVIGIYMEFSNPGLILPGVIGGTALLLALVAVQILPVNALGVLLIIMGIVLFVLEAKFASHGLLGLGGAISMLIGAMILIDSPITGLGVSLGVALGVTVPAGLIIIILMRLVLRSFKWKASLGNEQMVGQTCEVTQAIRPSGSAYDGEAGMVFLQGELWRATADEEIPKGAKVRVVKVAGLTVHVAPEAMAAAPEEKVSERASRVNT